jgi:hypothetical protein
MIDFRLFYPQISLDEQARIRRPIVGHAAVRVFRLPGARRVARPMSRR